MADALLVLTLGLLPVALLGTCGRGVRPPGISFVEVAHDHNRASKRANRVRP
jgi:hypothetical protein